MKHPVLLATFAAAASLMAFPAQALVITFGGQNTNVSGGDNSGLTSNFVPVSNMIDPSTGYYIETFDLATKTPIGNGSNGTTAAVPGSGIKIAQGNTGCSINSWGGPTFTAAGGGFAVDKGSVGGVNAAPANDGTCYGFGPQPQGGIPASVKVDFSPILLPGVKVNYLGIYYGSIDDYNNIDFYSGNDLLATLTGQNILDALGGTSGNQTGTGSNVYVNLAFGPDEAFTAFEFHTTGVAFEMDNVVVGLTSRQQVPEPASVALVGLALAGLGIVRRRSSTRDRSPVRHS